MTNYDPQFSILDKVAYSGVLRRAMKTYRAYSEAELLVPDKLSEIVKSEQRRIWEKKFIGPWATVCSIPGSLIETIISLKRSVIGKEFVPAVPEHDDTIAIPHTIDYGDFETTYYTYSTVHHKEVPAHYEPIYQTTLEHPWILAIAIGIPVGILAGLYARQNWLDFCERTVTKKNLDAYIRQRLQRV